MLGALRFLTVIPLPGAHRPPGNRDLLAFPLVGALVGLTWVLAALTTEAFILPAVAAALVLGVDALVTGALHLDALADVGDGVGSRRRSAEALAVMRDSAIGAVGATALLVVTLLRYGALQGIIIFPLAFAVPALVIPPMVGRAAMVLLLGTVSGRDGGSLAATVARPSGNVVAGVALIAAFLATALARGPGLAAAGAGGVVVVLWGLWWRRRFGVLTGDGAGAGGLLAETVALLVFALRAAF